MINKSRILSGWEKVLKTIVREQSQALYDNFHFAEAVERDGFLFCSGIIGTGEDGKLPPDISDEFRHAWRSVQGLLQHAGVDLDQIVECTTYHVGLQAHMGQFMAVRDEFLSAPWPAWTAIGIVELAVPGAHVEIRVTAALK